MHASRRHYGWMALGAWVGLLSACSAARAPSYDDAGPPVRGGTLKLAGGSDVDHLATTSAYTAHVIWLLRTFARELVTYPASPDFKTASEVVADLAETVPSRENGGISSDGLTYTFHLRHGVWWNSQPKREVTPNDIVRGIKLICNPVNPAGAPGYYESTILGMPEFCDEFAKVPGTVEDIKRFVQSRGLPGVQVGGDFTVRFTLQEPSPDFLNILAMPFAAPVPVEYLDYLPDSPEFRQRTISNGPYQIVKYTPGHEYQLDRNPVWDPATDPVRPAYVDHISVVMGMDQQLVQLQIEAGTIDLSFDHQTPVSELASLIEIDDPNIVLAPSGEYFGSIEYLVINMVDPNYNGALHDLRVRRAIEYAIDKTAIVQDWGGPRKARPARQAVPNSVSGFRSGADHYVTPEDRGDPSKARQLLKEAGYPDGLPLKFAYPVLSTFPLDAQSVQASLGAAGFKVSLTPYTSGDFYGRLLPNPEQARSGEWDIAIPAWYPDWYGGTNGRSVIEPLFDGRHFGPNTVNYGGYNNPEVNLLIDRATAAASVEEAEAAWFQAAARIMEDAAIVPLVETRNANTHSARTQGCMVDVFNLNCNLTAVWLARKP